MEELKRELREIKECQIRIEEDIRHHIKRTDILEELHKDNERRIGLLEEPAKAHQYLVKQLVGYGKVAGALLSILAIIGLIYKNL